MALEYPDIVCEYVGASERYECDGVQIVSSLEPARIPMGGYAVLILLFQNAFDVPVDLLIRPELPTTGHIKAEPVLEIGEPEMRAKLAPAQVGTLYVPVKPTARAREGQYELHLHVAVKTGGPGNRVRPARTAGRFQSELIDDVAGLELGRILGVPYGVIPTRKISLPLNIGGQAESTEKPPSTTSKFESLWKREDADAQVRAHKQVDAQRAEIAHRLTMEPMYAALLAEGQTRCAKAGAQLRVGEAIALGKILTYTALYFLGNANWQDGLLVPMWELAQKDDLPTDDALWVLRNVGFGHLARLGVALGFGLIAHALKKQPWDLEERRALSQEVANRLESGESLPIELVYIPLLAAATLIADKIGIVGEDVGQSLTLLKAAKAARADVFGDPDLAQASAIVDHLLDWALSVHNT
jgi:hypothetical protein